MSTTREQRRILKEVAKEKEEAPRRTHCSVCGVKKRSYQLEPGTGRCTECQP